MHCSCSGHWERYSTANVSHSHLSTTGFIKNLISTGDTIILLLWQESFKGENIHQFGSSVAINKRFLH